MGEVRTPAECGHDFVRYTLSWAHPGQADGEDADGRPYRDVPMTPLSVAHYAAAMGSDFITRVLSAKCRRCDHEFDVPK